MASIIPLCCAQLDCNCGCFCQIGEGPWASTYSLSWVNGAVGAYKKSMTHTFCGPNALCGFPNGNYTLNIELEVTCNTGITLAKTSCPGAICCYTGSTNFTVTGFIEISGEYDNCGPCDNFYYLKNFEVVVDGCYSVTCGSNAATCSAIPLPISSAYLKHQLFIDDAQIVDSATMRNFDWEEPTECSFEIDAGIRLYGAVLEWRSNCKQFDDIDYVMYAVPQHGVDIDGASTACTMGTYPNTFLNFASSGNGSFAVGWTEPYEPIIDPAPIDGYYKIPPTLTQLYNSIWGGSLYPFGAGCSAIGASLGPCRLLDNLEFGTNVPAIT